MKVSLLILLNIVFVRSVIASEVYLLDEKVVLPNNCIHYSAPNRYVCAEPFAQVEFVSHDFIEDVFAEPKFIEDRHYHYYKNEEDSDSKLMLYAICKDYQSSLRKIRCVIVISDDKQAFKNWFSSFTDKLYIDD